MRLRLQLGIVAAIAVALAAGWWLIDWDGDGVAGKGPGGKRAVVPVIVERIALSEDRVTVESIGTGEALKAVTLFPSVPGEVIEVGFQAGQQVAEGQALLRLDDEDQRLAVQLAEVDVAEAERQVRRYLKLAPSGVVSQVQLNTARAALQSANLRRAQAKADLADRTVRAPFAGVIGLTELHKGDRVSDSTAVATLDDRSAILVGFSVPESHAGKVRSGDPVAVRAWSMPDRGLEGRIAETGSRIDPVTRTLRVRARIPNPDGAIRPGTSFAVRLEIGGRSFPSVHEVAVLWSRDGAYVWRIVGGSAEKVFVAIIRRNRGRVLVDGELREGDLVVVEGVQGLRPGRAVTTTMAARTGTGTRQ